MGLMAIITYHRHACTASRTKHVHILHNQRSTQRFEIPYFPSAMDRNPQDIRQLPIQPATWTNLNNTPASMSQTPIYPQSYFGVTLDHIQAFVCRDSAFVPSFLPFGIRLYHLERCNVSGTWILDTYLHLDSEMFSIEDISAHLEWSHSLPIHVTITGETDTFMTKGLEENQRARSVTAVLCTHIRCCETIHYKVAHSSSLPIISPDLYYSTVTPHLQKLCSKSSARSGGCPSAGVLRPAPGVRSELCINNP